MTLKDYIPELNLASGSPARLQMLRDLGIKATPYPQNCVEETQETEPGKVVESLAAMKLRAFMNSADFTADTPALSCDTLLYFNGDFIGKAHSNEEAKWQISSLSGKTHQVYSGYALYLNGKIFTGWDCADVEFSKITPQKLENYIAGGSWRGAAGSYHIFDPEVDFIESVKGDVNTVIGLPLEKLTDLLNAQCLNSKK